MTQNPSVVFGASLNVFTPMTVPLSSLDISPENVRSVEPSESGIKELAAMIEHQSLINPLTVTKNPKNGRYLVEAGGRRLRALKLLASVKKIPLDHPIRCNLIESLQAKEVSLAENISQEAMHPSDEFAAYKALRDQGRTEDEISAKFGVTPLHVARRLKLANVAPKLMGEFRKGKIKLDQMMAFAQSDDHTRQVLVWKTLGEYNNSAHSIRRKLIEEEVPSTDPRVKLVGLKAYQQAGGEVRRDLFSESGNDEFLTDPLLLDMMVADLLALKAEAVRSEGWKWVEILPEFDYQARQSYSEFPTTTLPESDAHKAQRLALELALEQAESAYYDNEDDDKDEALSKAVDDFQEMLDALDEALIVKTDPDKSLSGALVILEGSKVIIKRGQIRSSDRKLVTAKLNAAARGGDGEGGEVAGDSEDAKSSAIPEKLMLNLSAQRTAAIQASMLHNASVALASLATRMAMSVFDAYSEHPIKITLSDQWHSLQKFSPTVGTSHASNVISDERARWESRLPAERSTWFKWFIDQPQETSTAMIVFASVQTVSATQHHSDSVDHARELAETLGLNMSMWWEPTPENYLDLVPKSKLIEAVIEAKGEAAASGMDKLKKQEAIQHAAAALKGTNWLPLPLRSV